MKKSSIFILSLVLGLSILLSQRAECQFTNPNRAGVSFSCSQRVVYVEKPGENLYMKTTVPLPKPVQCSMSNTFLFKPQDNSERVLDTQTISLSCLPSAKDGSCVTSAYFLAVPRDCRFNPNCKVDPGKSVEGKLPGLKISPAISEAMINLGCVYLPENPDVRFGVIGVNQWNFAVTHTIACPMPTGRAGSTTSPN